MTQQLEFTSEPSELRRVRQAVREFLQEAGLTDFDAEVVILAIDEACTNVIRHAYHGREGCPVRLRMERTPRRLHMTLRDFGEQCPPERMVGRKLTDFRPGGIGLHIMHQAFDRVEFCHKGRGTLLRMSKVMPPPAPPEPACRE